MATKRKVVVKWGKNKYDVEIDLNETPLVFKTQLFTLTGVPTDRQKIMGLKGGVLKDDTPWEKCEVREGQQLMLVGSAEAVVEKPAAAAVTEASPAAVAAEEKKKKAPEVTGYHVGLRNLGNTCYMAASLQCMRSAPELADAICKFTPSAADAGDPRTTLARALRAVFEQLGRGEATVVPGALVAALRQAYPQFAEQNSAGHFKQQDAEELWTSVMMSLNDRMPAVRGLFEGKLASTMSCFENPEEPASTSSTTFTKLSCHIDQSIAFMIEGMRKGLVGEVDKLSPSLGRQARYSTKSAIASLPPYLTVQFVRFFWREDIKKKVKIVKPVQFPFVLDVVDLCEPALKEKLTNVRAKDREIEDINAGLIPKPAAPSAAAAAAPEPMDVDRPGAALVNETGMYELCGIVTHQGMYAEGGHYVGWSKESDDRWIKFDDDKVTVVPDAEILKLDGRGGGDWHIAYILLYRSKPRPKLQ